MAEGMTKLANLIDPEVFAPIVSAKIQKAIRFAPLAVVDTTLVGQAGSTLKFPAYDLIGDAVDVAEGTPIPLHQLGQTSKGVTVKKAGIGVEITDEAVLSGLGDPKSEAANQIADAIAHKVDDDLIAAIDTGSVQTATATAWDLAGVQAALDVFNDEDDSQAVIVMNPIDAGALRVSAGTTWLGQTEVGANALIAGTYGDVLGVQVVRSRKVPKGTAYIIKVGALRLVMKRNVMVESDRDIVKKTTVITGDEHYAPYVYDPTKIVKVTVGAGA